MADGRPGADVAMCPDCGAPVRPERDRLCPRCGYPLMFLRTEPESDVVPVGRVPGERDDGTGAIAPVPAAPRPAWDHPTPPDGVPAAGGQTACPRCGQANGPERVWCERCGQALRSGLPVQAPPPPPPAAPPGPRNRRAWLVVTAALSALLALLAVAFVASRFRPGGPLGTASPSAGAPPAAAPVPVLPVSATASSTNPELARYRVGSTLDGDRATAWNSHGDKLRSNIGVRLTYRFAGPVKLARVTIINGYARTPALYRGNHRVARLSVRTDGGAATPWQLADTTDPQTLTLPGAPTTSITLVVEEIHQGNKYKDVAITEITFQSLP